MAEQLATDEKWEDPGFRLTAYRSKARSYYLARGIVDESAIDDAAQQCVLIDFTLGWTIGDSRHRFVRTWNNWRRDEIRRQERRERQDDAARWHDAYLNAIGFSLHDPGDDYEAGKRLDDGQVLVKTNALPFDHTC